MIHVLWGTAIGLLGFLIAFDYRNFGLRVYDLMASFTPGGPPDPRFSPDVFRAIWGILGFAGICFSGFHVYNLLSS